MSKALVIKNADFSQNKVATVVFNDIPCTGVAFSSSSVTLSELGEAEIAYTITPSNTTDAVLLTSSDSTVVSVNGTTLTVVGIGSCVLTLTCGSYTATCNVTVDIYGDFNYLAGTFMYNGDSELGYGVNISGSSKRISGAKHLSDTDFNIGFPNLVQSGIIPLEVYAPIPIPQNANKIHFNGTKLYAGTNHNVHFFSDTLETFSKDNNTYVKEISRSEVPHTTSGGVTTINADVSIPVGAKGYVFTLRQHPDYASAFDNCTTAEDVTEIIEGTFNISVHYLPADS